MLLASNRYKPRLLLNIAQRMGSPSPNSKGSLALKVNSTVSEQPGCATGRSGTQHQRWPSGLVLLTG